MKFSITSWLAQKGVEKEEDLSQEEKVSLDRIKLILSGEKLITVDLIKAFCQSQILLIESACDGKTPLTSIQQAGLHIYLNIVKAIEAPEAERESLERLLTQELHG